MTAPRRCHTLAELRAFHRQDTAVARTGLAIGIVTVPVGLITGGDSGVAAAVLGLIAVAICVPWLRDLAARGRDLRAPRSPEGGRADQAGGRAVRSGSPRPPI